MPRWDSECSIRSHISRARALISSGVSAHLRRATAASSAAWRNSASIRCCSASVSRRRMSSRSSSHVVEAGVDREVLVDLRQLLELDLLDGHLERRLAPGELLVAVVVGEASARTVRRLARAARRRAPPRSRGSGCRRPAPRAGRDPRRRRTAASRAAPCRLAVARVRRDERADVVDHDEVALRRPGARPSAGAPGARASPRSPARSARSSTAGSRRATSRPLYSPSVAFGSTPISIENSSA